MPIVSFTIPTPIATELNDIAVQAGFPNAKAMVLAYLKYTIKTNRGSKALQGIREVAEAQADTDMAGLT